MPIRDADAMRRSLDNDYGVTAGPNAASSHLLALYVGDPMIPAAEGGGTEVDAVDNPGYDRAPVPRASWLPATAEGRKDLVAPIVLPDTAGEWDDAPDHWALLDADDPDVMWDCGPLGEPLEVEGAGSGPAVSVSIFYDDAVSSDDDD